jgi:hypothetical protein
MKIKSWPYLLVVFGALFLLLGQRSALADDILNVTVDTSSLSGQSGSEVIFILTDGSGTPDNTATLSAFGLGGGTAGLVDPTETTPGVTGDMGSTISIPETSFLNSFGQFFTPGSPLTFTLDLTTNPSSPTPDQFSMYIYDPNGNPISTTTDPTGFDSLFAINIDSTNPAFCNFAPSLVTASAVVTPEPATFTLLAMGLAGLGLLRKKREASV